MREFKTRDMAMAAYLVMLGHEEVRCEQIDGDSFAVMVFDMDDEELMDDVDVYHAGEARVEPKHFQQKITLVREQLKEAAGRTSRRGR
jgi:hypothetical protein